MHVRWKYSRWLELLTWIRVSPFLLTSWLLFSFFFKPILSIQFFFQRKLDLRSDLNVSDLAKLKDNVFCCVWRDFVDIIILFIPLHNYVRTKNAYFVSCIWDCIVLRVEQVLKSHESKKYSCSRALIKAAIHTRKCSSHSIVYKVWIKYAPSL